MGNRGKALLFAAGLALLSAGGPATAVEVAGVEIPERVAIAPEGTELVLNGAGVRKKFLVKVYVGALYLPTRAHEAEVILASPEPGRILMHFLHSKVEAEKLVEGWEEGFANNSSAAELEVLRERLARFNAFFPTVRRGDVVLLDLLPQGGTRVQINDRVLGTIPGEDFSRALLRVWLGRKPADPGLRRAMLGAAP